MYSRRMIISPTVLQAANNQAVSQLGISHHVACSRFPREGWISRDYNWPLAGLGPHAAACRCFRLHKGGPPFRFPPVRNLLFALASVE